MTYQRKLLNDALDRRPSKPNPNSSGVTRAARRIKPSPAYVEGMRAWLARTVRELLG
jgi:hypothetical protein